MKNNCVQTALDVVESLHLKFPHLWEEESLHFKFSHKGSSSHDDLEKLKMYLEFLRTFYYMLGGIGRRKCVSQSESTLLTIEEAVLKYSLEIQFICLCLNLRDHDDDDDDNDVVTISDTTKRDLLGKGISDFLAFLNSFLQEMKQLYQIFIDDSLLQLGYSSYSSFEEEEFELLIYVMDSLLQNLQYLQQSNVIDLEKYLEQFEAYLRFLKSFILFARFCGLEHSQMEDLLIHIGGLVVYAARFTFLHRFDYLFAIDARRVASRIFPFPSNVCEIYVGVLQELSTKTLLSQSSSSHQPSPAESQRIILGNFIDSLLRLILNQLRSYRGGKVTVSHQMQNLLAVLLYSRNVLMDKMHDLIQVVICKAAMIFCYVVGGGSRGLVGKLELLYLDMEEKFKLIKAAAAEEEKLKMSMLPPSAHPQTNLLGFIDSVLEKLKSVITYEADSLALANDKFQAIHDDLEFFRSFLVDVTTQRHQNGELQALWNLVTAVAYEMEFVLDSLVVGDYDPHGAVELLNMVIEKIKLIKAEASESFLSKRQITVVQRNATMSSKVALIPVSDELMVGMTDEAEKIIDQLDRGTKQLDIVSIVGMPGLGKTTLAKKVYCHASIFHRFHVCSWCCVSQEYNKKSVLLAILRGLGSTDQLSERNEDDLAEKLYKELKGKKYLIILDDIWDVAAWNSLKNSFPDDGEGSRILLTSRNLDVALQIKPDREPHRLRPLTNDESWELLQKKICLKEGCPPALLAHGKAIAEDCKGLPLMILIVGGLLSNIEPDTWVQVAEKLRKGTLSIPEQYMETLELSYLHLPDHLKPCFLYFGAFQEDQEIHVGKLLRLWFAEGFVAHKKTTEGDRSLEDVARGYMMELIQRNLVMVGKKGSREGRVKTCVLHDLLLKFCKAKCKEEHFMHCLHEYELDTTRTPLEEPRMLYRLRFDSANVDDFAESRLLFSPQVRTLFFIPHYRKAESAQETLHSYGRLYMVMLQCKVLRVLEFRPALCLFPREIGQLVHLKYLAWTSLGGVIIIPSLIGNLSNLETFIVKGAGTTVWLPNTLWDMKKLRCLRGSYGVFWVLPKVENLDDGRNLESLQTLYNVRFDSRQTMEEVMRKFPNIRKFRCVLEQAHSVENEEHNREIAALDFMSGLESLFMLYLSSNHSVLEIEYPQNLKKLDLSWLGLPWSKISAINGLPNLEVLKIRHISFRGENWEMEEGVGKFPKLRFLHLHDLDLVRWTTSPEFDNDSFLPCLKKLVLHHCYKLEQVPISCLAYHSSLQMIEVYECKYMGSSIQQIEEEKTNCGNEDLKIIMRKDSIRAEKAQQYSRSCSFISTMAEPENKQDSNQI